MSALPPPLGGIQTWTEILCKRGLPAPFEVDLVDARVTRGHQDIPPTLNPSEVKRFVRILWKIHRSLRTGRFSVMHLNCSPALPAAPRNVISALIARRAGVPYVVHLRGTFRIPAGTGAGSRFYTWAYRTMFEGAAAILALGQPSYRSVMELGAFAHKTVTLLPNFVDFRVVPDRDRDESRRDELRVIYTGRLVESKGVRTVVDVAERVRCARFQLVGDGPPESRRALLGYIRDRGLQERVHVLGPVTNREVLQMLAGADVFLFPSPDEGFPNSVAEAMAVGLPVVASRAGAIPEMIDMPEGGCLAAFDDVEAHAGALIRLRDDPALRAGMGRHNRRKALREYDYAPVVKQLCSVYRGILYPRTDEAETSRRHSS